jgi:hypothetical protein
MNVSRDPMLIFACVLSLLPAVALAIGSSALDRAGASAGIANLHDYVVPVALLLPAFLIGWVSGFLLLEDRDDGTLLAVEVTPVGRAGFLGYRLAISAAITALITALGIALLLPEVPMWLKLVLLVTVPADTVLASVALLALARNKVEGLALTKLTNIAAIVPLAAFIPSPVRLLGGIVPTYWVGEMLRMDGVAAWLSVCLLAATHTAAALGLSAAFRRRVG